MVSFLIFVWNCAWGENQDALSIIKKERKFWTSGATIALGHIIPTHHTLQSIQANSRTLWSYRGKVGFHFAESSMSSQIYGNPIQGIGLGLFELNTPADYGRPWSVYLFQSAEVAKISSFLSLRYGWNFGISANWHPYDETLNDENEIIGSDLNAYINVGMHLEWKLSKNVHLQTGIELSHFSNGNTHYPNAGLNAYLYKVGLNYRFSRKETITKPKVVPKYRKHFCYDLLLFGSKRRTGVTYGEDVIPSPFNYWVGGINFTTFYRLGYRIKVGIGVDGIFDESANTLTEASTFDMEPYFLKASPTDQFALGVSAKVEYIMPIFTLSVGVGRNILGKGTLENYYQQFALKIDLVKSIYLNIGYNLYDFKNPNFLMLGVGIRFND